MEECIRDQYEAELEIGRGGFAKVYSGFCNKRRKFVAVKMQSYAHDLAKEEARKLRMFNGLKGIPDCYDSGYCDCCDCHYMVVELVGTSLYKARKDYGRPFSCCTTLCLIEPLLEALGVLHSQGLLHNDIKGDNMAIAMSGNGKSAYLLDLGLATIAAEENHGRSYRRDLLNLATTFFRYITGESWWGNIYAEHNLEYKLRHNDAFQAAPTSLKMVFLYARRLSGLERINFNMLLDAVREDFYTNYRKDMWLDWQGPNESPGEGGDGDGPSCSEDMDDEDDVEWDSDGDL